MQPFVNEVNTAARVALPAPLGGERHRARGAGGAVAGAGGRGARGEDADALRVPRGGGPGGSEAPHDARKVGGTCCITSWFPWPSSSGRSTSSGTSPSGRRARFTALVVTLLFGPAVIDRLSAMRARAGGAGGRPAEPPEEGGHAHHGRRPDPAGGDGGHAPVGPAHQPVHLAGPVRDAGHGGGGVRGRLPEAHAGKPAWGCARGQKFFWQVVIGLVVGAYLYVFPTDAFTTKLAIPFLKNWMPELGIAYIAFAMLVLVGCSNAVNLTDGLDGLAIVPTLMAAATFTFFAYVAGNAVMARYLQVIFVRGASELPVFAAALVGASLGFLWYNAHPAQVFMGDTGSLALGAALATVALVTKNELVLVVAGGCFVVEALSVIIQVFWFRRTGKRVFRMAPIHHHYELNGLPEPKIIVRFWIVSFVLQVISADDAEAAVSAMTNDRSGMTNADGGNAQGALGFGHWSFVDA